MASVKTRIMVNVKVKIMMDKIYVQHFILLQRSHSTHKAVHGILSGLSATCERMRFDPVKTTTVFSITQRIVSCDSVENGIRFHPEYMHIDSPVLVLSFAVGYRSAREE